MAFSKLSYTAESRAMDITEKDAAVREQYQRTKPKYLGNLHERMQLVMALAGTAELRRTHVELWTAIQALQIEVKYYKPQDPPYADRCVTH